MASLVNTIAKKHGRIDILVNTVGGYLGGKSVVELEEEEWNKMFGINLLSAFLITKHVLPLMLQSGYGRWSIFLRTRGYLLRVWIQLMPHRKPA